MWGIGEKTGFIKLFTPKLAPAFHLPMCLPSFPSPCISHIPSSRPPTPLPAQVPPRTPQILQQPQPPLCEDARRRSSPTRSPSSVPGWCIPPGGKGCGCGGCPPAGAAPEGGPGAPAPGGIGGGGMAGGIPGGSAPGGGTGGGNEPGGGRPGTQRGSQGAPRTRGVRAARWASAASEPCPGQLCHPPGGVTPGPSAVTTGVGTDGGGGASAKSWWGRSACERGF